MTASSMFERVNDYSCSFPCEKTATIDGKTCYKFYQLELQQLFKQDYFQQKLDANCSKGISQRSRMERQREKTKLQARFSDGEKRSNSFLSMSNRVSKETVPVTLPASNNSTESRSKYLFKTKQSSP
ncbi:unnamed protein product [Adineta ricciae]|uniref:Uncharacterized protein n=1 Tax=Adineta ricciae TaxID=249248 RepID=A0A815FUT9_ADIRI|nr:unnamed protein product [Adineta ricciae]CAF1325983.1 unnamed protein product [Adineta ricciae]